MTLHFTLHNLKLKHIAIAAIFIILVIIAYIAINPSNGEKPTSKSYNKLQKQTIDSLLIWHPMELNNNEEKLEYIAGAKSMAINFGSAELIGDVFFQEANIYRLNYQFSKAITSFKTAEKYYEKDNCLEKQSQILLHLAFTYSHLGEFDKALEYCNKGIDIYKKCGNKMIGCKFYNQKGKIYDILKDPKSTKKFYEQALELSYMTNDGRLISRCINDLGNLYNSMGNDSLALLLYNKSICASNDSAALLRYYNNIGNIYLNRHENEKAFEYLKKAQNYDASNEKEYIVYWTIGEYYYNIKQYDSTITYLNYVLDIIKTRHFNHELLDVHQILGQAYLKAGNSLKAYQELEECIKIQDEIFSLQKGIAVSKVENELVELKREQKRARFNFIATIIGLGICFIFYAIWFRIKYYRKSLHIAKKSNETLQQENGIIKDSLNSKESELVSASLKLAQNEDTKDLLANKIAKMKNGANSDTIKYLNSVLNNLKNEASNENMWDEFEIRFNHANDGFYKNLIAQHPNLSKSDKKLCAFLRLNLSTKEISLLTGQTPNSIFVARTRLRKKLNLANSKVDIAEYLQNL